VDKEEERTTTTPRRRGGASPITEQPTTPSNSTTASILDVDNNCANSNATMTEAMACKHWLAGKGSTPCRVPADGSSIIMCNADVTKIFARSLTGIQEQSNCSDVATGVQWIIDNCGRPDGTIAGISSPERNGNIALYVWDTVWTDLKA